MWTAWIGRVLACLTIVCASIATVRAADDEPRRWALLIGVNDYATLRGLNYCVADIQAMRDKLVACGFPADQVYLLRDRAEKAAMLPTKRNIERQIRLLASLVKKNDLVVVAFSGHGVQLGQKVYWCPTEADTKDPAGTLVPLDLVYNELQGCPAALRLIVADACRDDPRPPEDKAGSVELKPDGVAKAMEHPPEGILVLSSCGQGEKSKEDDRFQHGVFTHFLLEALSGEADVDSDRRIALGELFDYAGTKTQKHVADVFRDFQRPKLSGELAAGVMRFPITPAPLTPPLAVAPFDADAALQHQQEWAKFHRRQANETNSIGMKLAFIPPGEFLMGSPESEKSHGTDELQHRVKISKPFYLGVYEVTQAEYQEVMGTNPSYFSSFGLGKDRVQGLDTSRFPVEQVSWEDVQEFCRKLSRKEGRTYRLPTEAEWEYACRAGAKSPFHFGAELNGNQANCDGRFPYGTTLNGRSLERPTSVGTYTANAFGLYNMHGNVWEWCADWYDRDYYGNSPAEDPRGAASGSDRGNRGGGWNSSASDCRSANRSRFAPADRGNDLGFRVACVPSGE